MLNLEIPDQIYQKAESNHRRRRIRRLPPLLREEEGSKHKYTPRVIALGPFHHGKPDLHLGETFKHKALQTFLSTMDKDKSFLYDKIMADIDDIRGCYDDDQVPGDDSSLAEMMLLDGCFVVSLMEVISNSERLVDILYAIGMVGFSYATRDMIMLENQIPFRVINLLIRLRYDDARKGEDLLNDFLNFAAFQGHFSKKGGGQDSSSPPPIHLLEAIRRKLVSKPQPSNISHGKKVDQVSLRTRLYTSRSVTDLKAKGVGFEPSPTACLRDVKFTSHGIFSGNLELPPLCISDKTKVLFANLVAYETSSGNINDYAVSSYINLMKSLIHCAEDVKELREKRILISNLGSDEQVFRGFKEIDTYGAENAGIFHDVKERVEEHYNSKAKTYMAELMHTYFESPWTAIALLAAALLLLLTSLQTYFTIHPTRF